MNNWEYAKDFPTNPWRGAMTLPREISLNSIDQNLHLCANPVPEIESYRGEKITAGNGAQLLEINASVAVGEGKSTKIRVTGDGGKYFEFGYDAANKSIFVDRTNAWCEIPSSNLHSVALANDEKIIDIRTIVDSSSVEIYVARGAYVFTELIFLPGANRRVTFEAAGDCQPPRTLAVCALTTRR